LISNPEAHAASAPLIESAAGLGQRLLLTEADGGTEILAVHDNVPPGIAPADNELGWRMSLQKLARLVEAGATP
jgi:hypothetical protein